MDMLQFHIMERKGRWLFCTLLLFLSFTFLSGLSVSAQVLQVTGGHTAWQLANMLTGPGITINNATMNCPNGASGSFDGTNSNIGMDDGVLLTTGQINNAPGPNISPGTSGDNGAFGDPDLDTLLGTNTVDACALEFDVVADCDTLQISYIFASEEYLEFVGLGFNDGFGFYISGPGYSKPTNIALVPGTAQPVHVNTINSTTNSGYYIDNAGGLTVEYDGFTVPLTAKAVITPCATYHVKLVIADAVDRQWDSGVFLKMNGMRCPASDVTLTAALSDTTYANMREGCVDGIFTFTRDGDTTVSLNVGYYVSGTSTNGTDYPNLSGVVTFPANSSTVDLTVSAFTDNVTEGLETIIITLNDTICGFIFSKAETLSIEDHSLIDAGADRNICDGDTTTIGSASTAGFSYAWSPTTGLSDSTISNPDLSLTSPGVHRYYLTQTDTAGCSAIDSLDITVDYYPNSAFTTTTPHCVGDTADIIYTGGDPAGLIYTWNFAGGTTASGSGQGPYEIYWAGSGMKNVTLSINNNGCVSTITTVPVEITDPGTLSFAVTDVTCNGTNNGAIDLTVSGGNAPFNYSWTGPGPMSSNLEDISGLSAGTYLVTVTDTSGCVVDDSATVNEPTAVSGSFNTSDANCFGGADGWAKVTASGGTPGYTYSWNTSPVQNSDSATGLTAGTYIVTVSDANGCTYVDSVIISEPTPINISQTLYPPLCPNSADGSIKATVTGGNGNYSYSWNPTAQTSDSASGLIGGQYILTLTDTAYVAAPPGYVLCTYQDTVDLIAPLAFVLSTDTSDVNCNGGNDGWASISVSGGTAGYTYSWNSVPVQTTDTAFNLPAGGYTVAITDTNGCIVAANVNIDEPTPLASGMSMTPLSCNGGSDGTATVSPSGGTPGYNFSWNTAPVQTTSTATGLSIGTYVVTISDANGCTRLDSITITEPSPISLSLAQQNVSCNGGSNAWASVSPSGGTPGYTYSWNTVPVQSSDTAFALTPGTYIITVSDANGCTQLDSVTIIESTSIGIVLNPTNPSCNSNADGNIGSNVTGGQGNYSYSWSPGLQTTDSISNLLMGTYILTVTDTVFTSGGYVLCVAVDSVTIAPTNPLVVTPGSLPASCNGGTDGSAFVTNSGGTPGYSVVWATVPAQFSDTASGLAAGNYAVTVTDASGCIVNSNVTVDQAVALITNMNTQNLLCAGVNNGWADVDITGGSTPYSYSWNTVPVQTTDSIIGLSAGQYIVTITDSNLCQIQDTANITQPTALSLSMQSQDVSCNAGNDGIGIVSASGGTPGYTYSWNTVPVQSGDTATGLSPGTYIVTVTDANGCTGLDSVIISEPAALNISFSGTNPQCWNSTGSIDATITGGNGNYHFFWEPDSIYTEDITGIPAGTYKITVTDTAYTTFPSGYTLCTVTDSFTLVAPSTITVSVNSSDVTCNGGNDGVAWAIASGGTPGYNYVWNTSPIQINDTAFGLTAGNDTVLVQDALGCLAFGTVTINEPPAITATVTSTNVTCNGANDGTAKVAAGGGTPGYTYSWNTVPTQSTDSIGGLSAGTYIVTITDTNGCTHLDSAIIIEPNVISLTTGTQIVSCNGGNDGFAWVNVIGGTSPFNYSWNTVPVQMSDTAFGLSVGTYTVIVNDAAGCMDSATVNITESSPLGLTLTPTNILCNSANTGSIATTPSGGQGNYSYLWSPGSQTTANISGLAPGTYTLTLTDTVFTSLAPGYVLCTYVDSVTISEPTALILSLSKTDVSCNGFNDGEAVITVSGGTAGYTYSWNTSPVQTTDTASNLLAGTYTIIVTDANGCIDSATIVINEPAAIVLTSGSIDATCNGISDGFAFTSPAGGVPGYSYSWNTVPVQTADTASGLPAGSYIVIVTDASGCSVQDTITVNQPTPFLVNSDSMNATCNGGNDGWAMAAGAGGTGPYSYSWNTTPMQPTDTAFALPAGIYTATVTDAMGCISNAIVNVGEPSPVSISFNLNAANCNALSDAAVKATVSGGHGNYSYLWTPGLQTTDSIDNLPGGTYTLTVTDTFFTGGTPAFILCTTLDSILIPNNDSLGLFMSATDATCNGFFNGTATVTATLGNSPYTFSWNSSPAQGTQTAIGLSTGTYEVYVTDNNGCSDTGIVFVDEATSLVNTLSKQDISCNGGSDGWATVSVAGGTPPYAYSWSSSPTQTSDTAFNLSAGLYILTVTDANFCTQRSIVSITEPTVLTITSGGTDVNCNGGNDGVSFAALSGGTPPYSYLWNPGAQATDTATGLVAGTYYVIGTDSLACNVQDSVSISEPTPLAMTLTPTHNTCSGASNGTITSAVSGGHSIYSYLWSPGGSTASDLSGLSPGTYTLTISDTSFTATGFVLCTLVDSVTVTEPTPLSLTMSMTEPGCFGFSDGTATVAVSGSTPGYSYAWNTVPVQTTSTATGLATGNYTVIVSDTNGCIDSATVTVTQPAAILITPTVSNVTCPGGNDGWISLNVGGGLPGYSYLWYSTQITDSIFGLTVGNYTVVVTDASGCQDSTTIPVNEPPAFIVNVVTQDVSCNSGNDGMAFVQVSGATPGYTYSWSSVPVQNNDTAFGLPLGSYLATITDTVGCVTTEVANINEPSPVTLSFNAVDPSCFGFTDGNISANVNGGNGNYGYTWSAGGQTTSSISNLGTGTYILTLTDTAYTLLAPGYSVCTLIDSITITAPLVLAIDLDTTDISCFGANDGMLVANVTGGTTVYNYAWNTLPVQTNSNVTNLGPGTYKVIVTDAQGCVDSASAPIAEPAQLTTIMTTKSVNCNGGNNGSATVIALGGTVPYSYSWNTVPVQTSDTASNLTAGIYIATVTDANGCVVNDTIEVIQPTALVITIVGVDAHCFGSNDGEATAHISGGTPFYTYSWNTVPSQIDTTATNLSPGTYTFTVTDGKGCIHSENIIINEPAPLAITLIGDSVSCAGGNDGAINTTVVGGWGNYGYLWTPVNLTIPNLSNIPVGPYWLTVTDTHYTINGAFTCTESDSIIISEPDPLFLSMWELDPTCNGFSNGKAAVEVTGGVTPYNYLWNSIPVQVTDTAHNLPAGPIQVTVRDAHGCQDSNSTVLGQPAPLAIAFSTVSVSCNGGADGSATANVTGGTVAYQYAWSTAPSQISQTASNLSVGTYAVVITDYQGCIHQDSILVNEPLPLSASFNVTNVTCLHGNDGTISATVSGGVGGYTYQWLPGLQNVPNITNLQAGNYQLIVTDANGCVDTFSTVVIEPLPLQYNLTTTPNTCNIAAMNGTATVTVFGGNANFTFSWNTNPVQTYHHATGLAPGTYTVTITDLFGCNTYAAAVIGDIPEPVVQAYGNAIFCEGEGGDTIFAQVVSGGQAPYYYTWWCDTTNTWCGLDSVNDNDPLANPTQTTTYYVQVTDFNGCVSNVDSTVVIVLPKPEVLVGPDQYVCSDSAPCVPISGLAFGAPGPYSYQWFPSVGLSNDTITTPCARPDTTTIYHLIATSANGCTSDMSTLDTNSTLTVHVTPPPIASAGPDHDICFGDTVQLNGVGTNAGPTYSYQWSPSTSLDSANSPAPFASPAITTEYTFTVWSNGCPSISDTVRIDVHTIPTNDAGNDVEICLGENAILNGTAWGDPTSPVYSYHWWPMHGMVSNHVIEDPIVSPDSTLTYYMIATSVWGCQSAMDSATVFVKPSPQAEAGQNQLICNGNDITLNGSYFYPPNIDSVPNTSMIYYNWTPAGLVPTPTIPNPIVNPTQTTWYYLSVQYNTCESTDSVLITVMPGLGAQIAIDTNTICQGESVQITVTGGISDPKYTWFPTTGLSDTTIANPIATPGDSTVYILIIEEGGCSDTLEVDLNVIPMPNVDILNSIAEGCENLTVSFIDLTAGGIGRIWDFDDGTPVQNNIDPTHTFTQAGNYNVKLNALTNGNCSVTDSVMIRIEEPPIADFNSNPMYPATLNAPNTNVKFLNLSENAVEYIWNFGEGQSSVEEHPEHLYKEEGEFMVTLTAISEYGCVHSTTHGPYIVLSPDLFIANVFSPNGDGSNDRFRINYTGDQPLNVHVYNRWGNLVFNTNNKNDMWDGNVEGGKKSAEGTYYYTIKVGTKDFTGYVTLIR